MARYLQFTWFRNAILLASFGAGGLVTLAMPSYEEMAAVPTERREARKTLAAPSEASEMRHEVTGVESGQRRLEIVGSIN